MDYKFLIVATDRVAGMPIDDGGKGSQAGGGGGPWNEGFKTLKGDWEPEGFRVIEFPTDTAAEAWYKGDEGTKWAKGYESIIMLRVRA